jgi:hypothetical protein
MTSGLSGTTEDTMLDHILGRTELVFDTTLFLALGTTAAPNRTSFSEVMVPGEGGYTRQAIEFDAAADGVAVNAAGTLTFGPCADTAWGTIRAFALWTDQTATAVTNRVLQGALTDQTKVVGIGDSVTVAAGAITVTVSPTA